MVKQVILLNKNENLNKFLEIEQNKFIKNILQELGLDVDSFWKDDILNVSQRQKLRELLLGYQINIIDDLDGHIQAYHKKQLIGEFLKPDYVLKKDLSEIDPRNIYYLEAHLSFWSIFDE